MVVLALSFWIVHLNLISVLLFPKLRLAFSL